MPTTLAQLAEMVADLAEEVAYGTAGHIRPRAQNKALAVLQALRPSSPVPDAVVAVGEMCLHKRKKDDDDSEVCTKARGHEGGHNFSGRPKPVAEPKTQEA